MDYDRLWNIGELVRSRGRLTPEDKRFIADVIPQELSRFPDIPWPSRVEHPAGFSIAGAPVRTFVRAILLLSAQQALGRRYAGESEFYARVESNLAFGIMRSHFHHGHPKGTFCCAKCTLAVYPVLKAHAIRWFDCGKLAASVRQIIVTRSWRFASPTNSRMIAWALNENRG